MNGLVIAAPRSGSGKTIVTLGLLAALRHRGLAAAPAKTGPDYIDTAILARSAGRAAINLDPWAMAPTRLRTLAVEHAAGADLLVVEGVMGLFDGAADGLGSTADLAATLGLPVVLVLDAERQSQSIAALAHGFVTWRPDIRIAGLIVNRAASTRHELMLRSALAKLDVPLLGILPRRDTLVLPDRHLGLVFPDEIAHFDQVVATAAEAVEEYVDLDLLLSLSSPAVPPSSPLPAGERARVRGSHGDVHIRDRARSLRSSQTDAETRLWWRIRDRRLEGLKFVRQFAIGPYFADFACREAMLVVELDGGQHSGAAPDERRTRFLNAEGYSVLRFWNNEVHDNLDGVLDALLRTIRNSPSPDLRFAPATLSPVGRGDGVAPWRTDLRLPPLGQHIAIAHDDAFAFLYPHWLADWRASGAKLSFFSPLADEAPDPAADAVFLPGGYPELHAARLAASTTFLTGLRDAASRGNLIYGECGGFMVLGATLTDKSGATWPMSGLLPHETRIDRPKRVLGYRRLAHQSPLPFPARLTGHEFHYSSARRTHGTPLFSATDALGESLPPMGLVEGRVMGSYAHVIDVA